mmetsp:Transcript_32873/g.82870  ORF Transcript_32873/g.82870 Transcript_32873/m.82870 type:complete len:191 (-) Transcript_32873:486-1058(-)
MPATPPGWRQAYALAAARCLSTHYCSDVCQREAWANHKLLCKTLGAGREGAFAARERSAPGSAKKSLKMDDDVIMAWYRAFPGLAVDRVSSLEAPTRKPHHQGLGAVDQLILVSGRDGDSSASAGGMIPLGEPSRCKWRRQRTRYRRDLTSSWTSGLWCTCPSFVTHPARHTTRCPRGNSPRFVKCTTRR